MDYKQLGFRCGVEIHQQLDTKKLFCDCPSLVNDQNKPDILIKRKLRAVVGETGQLDAAALHEVKKEKTYLYEACSSSSCLVELDEEPPHQINQDALKVALQVSKLLNARIVDEIQVMRKTVIDGSNVSGFQRTALVAMDGHIETSKGKISIPSICLEEEAAKKISDNKDSITYRLDRLGIPLIEIGTSADIMDPEHAKEVASQLGMILRSTGKVKRGIGSIRQDVNVSIKAGARVEIKGFQELKSIPKVIEFEINRQLQETKKGKKLQQEVRKAEPDCTTSFLRPMPGAARMYPETDVLPIKISKELLSSVASVELITDKVSQIENLGIKKDSAKEILEQNIDIAGYIKSYTNLKPQHIADIIITIPKEISSRLRIDSSSLKQKDFEEVLDKLNQNKIPKEAVIDILALKAQGKKIDYASYATLDDKEAEKIVKDIIAKNKGASPGALMGLCMAQLRGKVDGKKVSELLKKYS